MPSPPARRSRAPIRWHASEHTLRPSRPAAAGNLRPHPRRPPRATRPAPRVRAMPSPPARRPRAPIRWHAGRPTSAPSARAAASLRPARPLLRLRAEVKADPERDPGCQEAGHRGTHSSGAVSARRRPAHELERIDDRRGSRHRLWVRSMRRHRGGRHADRRRHKHTRNAAPPCTTAAARFVRPGLRQACARGAHRLHAGPGRRPGGLRSNIRRGHPGLRLLATPAATTATASPVRSDLRYARARHVHRLHAGPGRRSGGMQDDVHQRARDVRLSASVQPAAAPAPSPGRKVDASRWRRPLRNPGAPASGAATPSTVAVHPAPYCSTKMTYPARSSSHGASIRPGSEALETEQRHQRAKHAVQGCMPPQCQEQSQQREQPQSPAGYPVAGAQPDQSEQEQPGAQIELLDQRAIVVGPIPGPGSARVAPVRVAHRLWGHELESIVAGEVTTVRRCGGTIRCCARSRRGRPRAAPARAQPAWRPAPARRARPASPAAPPADRGKARPTPAPQPRRTTCRAPPETPPRAAGQRREPGRRRAIPWSSRPGRADQPAGERDGAQATPGKPGGSGRGAGPPIRRLSPAPKAPNRRRPAAPPPGRARSGGPAATCRRHPRPDAGIAKAKARALPTARPGARSPDRTRHREGWPPGAAPTPPAEFVEGTLPGRQRSVQEHARRIQPAADVTEKQPESEARAEAPVGPGSEGHVK